MAKPDFAGAFSPKAMRAIRMSTGSAFSPAFGGGLTFMTRSRVSPLPYSNMSKSASTDRPSWRSASVFAGDLSASAGFLPPCLRSTSSLAAARRDIT